MGLGWGSIALEGSSRKEAGEHDRVSICVEGRSFSDRETGEGTSTYINIGGVRQGGCAHDAWGIA
jgi:hypothetical protein